MRDLIKNFVLTALPPKRKKAPKGWTTFNAPCCTHRGETPDKRGRGGVRFEGDTIGYHCFNCKYSTGYVPGAPLGYKFVKLLEWLGVEETEIHRLKLEALRIRELYGEVVAPTIEEEEITFVPRELPPNAMTFHEWATYYQVKGETPATDFSEVVLYADSRVTDISTADYYWAPSTTTKYKLLKMHRRWIIPCYWQGEYIGYIARAIDRATPKKYYAQYDSDFVYNIDEQKPDSKFVIVVEGALDAKAIGGVGVLSAEISHGQDSIIKTLNRQIILVPDKDKAGYGMIDDALEYGYSVAFPDWEAKDIDEAVKEYGKLFVLKTILATTATSKTKIEILRKKIKL